MLLLIDNYDSFTYNLKDYFQQLGEEVLVKKNDEITAANLTKFKFNKVVLSPGPNTPTDSGNLMEIVPYVCGSFPVLGICLGHQAIGQFFGSQLRLANRPMHGKVSKLIHDQKGIYSGLPETFNVCRYHSLVIDLKKDGVLVETARTRSGECMGFEHKTLRVWGMQYHPEAILTEHGLDLLKNWLEIISK